MWTGLDLCLTAMQQVSRLLLVLWRTSCFHIVSHVAHSVGYIDMSAVLRNVIEISNVGYSSVSCSLIDVVSNHVKLRKRGESAVYARLVKSWK